MSLAQRRAKAADDYQVVIAAPGFCLGVQCDEQEIHSIRFLPPSAEVVAGNALAAEAARQIRAYLADSGHVFGLPLRPAGTLFQRRVWQQISAIPAGRTRSYGELADELHSAPRAVGQACGANPYPLVVPCHRVLARGGRLGGFAHHHQGFPLDVKRWLLAHEAG